MAHVLAVAAGQLGDPMVLLVRVVSNDRLSHDGM